MIPFFVGKFGKERKIPWDMNDLQAATFTYDGWLAYMVKAVD